MLVPVLLLLILAGFGVVQFRFVRRRRRLRRATWPELLARVQPVELAAVRLIAENFLHPSKEQLRMEPGEMWESIGKLNGLQALHANADAMLDLAAFAARWNQVEGRIVAEMIRRDGVRLKRAVIQIELGLFFSVGMVFAPFQLQEAAAAYHLMRGRLQGIPASATERPAGATVTISGPLDHPCDAVGVSVLGNAGSRCLSFW